MKYGISWHHAGNNAKMRNATEMLFREKFLNVVIATTTLAQGIHMPCRSAKRPKANGHITVPTSISSFRPAPPFSL